MGVLREPNPGPRRPAQKGRALHGLLLSRSDTEDRIVAAPCQAPVLGDLTWDRDLDLFAATQAAWVHGASLI